MHRLTSRRLVRHLGPVLLLSATIVLLVGTPVDAVQRCRTMRGKLVAKPLSGPACTSPIGFCTQGTLSGGLRGTFSFAASSLVPTADTPTTGVVLYTGDTTVQAGDSTLQLKNAGALRAVNTEGDAAEVDTVVAGTGNFAGARGGLRLTGTFVAGEGGESSYEGTICTP